MKSLVEGVGQLFRQGMCVKGDKESLTKKLPGSATGHALKQIFKATPRGNPDRAALDLFPPVIIKTEDGRIRLPAQPGPAKVTVEECSALIVPSGEGVSAEDLIQAVRMQGAAATAAQIMPVMDRIGPDRFAAKKALPL